MVIGIDARLWAEGGVGRYTQNLIRYLCAIRSFHTFVVFGLKKDVASIQRCVKKDNWKVVPVTSKWHSISEQTKFPIILNAHKIDLMHFPYISVPLFYRGPFLVTVHDLIPYHFATGEATTLPPFFYKVKRVAYKKILLSALSRSLKIIAVSFATKKDLVQTFRINPRKIAVIYEGVDSSIEVSSSALSSEERSILAVLKEQEYLLYVGNAYPHKNISRLIDAFSALLQDNPSLKLFLVGKDDFFYRRLRGLINKMGLEKSVIHLGFVSNALLAHVYKNAQACVLPSLMEGFGLPILEAMENHCLVVCSDIEAFQEVALSTALYFNPNQTESMVKALEKALGLKTHQKTLLIQKAREHARGFSWSTMAHNTLRLYESSISIRSGK